MKTYLLLIFTIILYSCGSGSSTSEKTEDDAGNDSSSTEVETKSDEKTLSENNNYSDLFLMSACENFSSERVAAILEVPADQLKSQVNQYETNITCSWGYYPQDPKDGKNISVKLYDDEYTTEMHFSGDMKSMKDTNYVVEENLDVNPAVIATYRQDRGWLKVYISKSRMMEFQIGPTMQMTDEERSNLKKAAIEFAEAFLTQ